MKNSNYYKDNSTINTPVKKKKLSLPKILALLLIVILLGAFTLSVTFSNEKIITILQAKYLNETGTKLKIEDLDFKFFKEEIILNNISSTTSSGEKIGSIEKVILKLNILNFSDIYNLYMNNLIPLDYLELINVKFSDIPYLQIIKKITPKNWNNDYNLKIAQILDNNQINISYLYFKKTSTNNITFDLNGKFSGTYSGQGKFKGNISDFNSKMFDEISISAETKNLQLNIPKKNINAKYTGSLEYKKLFLNIDGILSTNETPLEILNAIKETTYKGQCIWDIKENKLNISNAIITNKEGLLIKGNGSITNPTTPNETVISAKISNSHAQIPDTKLDNENLKLLMKNGFNFKGNIYIAPDKLDITGKIDSPEISLTNKTFESLNSNISADFKATLHSILLENIISNLNNATLSGSIFIPFNNSTAAKNVPFNYNNIEANLNIHGDLLEISKQLYKLGYYFKPALFPQGNTSISIVTEPQNNESDFTITAGSNDPQYTIYNRNRQKLNFGRFTFQLNGKITKKNKTIISSVKLKSSPLTLSLLTNQTTDKDSLKINYDIIGKTDKLLPFINTNLYNNATNLISSLTIQGQGIYNFKTMRFESSMTLIDLLINNDIYPSHLTIEGPVSLVTKENWPVKLNQSTVKIIDSTSLGDKKTITCNAVIKSEAELFKETMQNKYKFFPRGFATIGARSNKSSLVKLFSSLNNLKERPFTSDGTTLKAKLNFNDNKVDISTKFSLNNFTINNPVDFTSNSMLGEALLTYNIFDNKLAINELKLTDHEKSYEYTAAGNFYVENAIFEGFTSKLSANLNGFLQHFKGYGEEQKLEGNIEIITELVGTSSSPNLTMVGKSNKIKITRYGKSDTATDFKFDAQLSWDREPDGSIYGLKAKEIFLKSSNASIYLNGFSERFHLRKSGIVNFGNGCNLNILLNGNRKLLWMLIPEYFYNGTDIGDKKSISISANVKAKEFPLFSFEKDLKKTYLHDINVSKGKIKVDKFTYNEFTIKDITSDFSLKNGTISATSGNGYFSGKMSFSGTTKFNDIPSGKIKIALNNIDIANALSKVQSENPVINGWLNLPLKSNKKSLEVNWEGSSLKDILKSLTTKREKAQIKDLVVETTNKKQDWEKYLTSDFSPNLANEIAKQIDYKLAPTYGKKKKLHYKYCNIEYKTTNGVIRIYNAKCLGANTADLLIKGIISFDGKIKLRVYITSNINKSFDVKNMLKFPSLEGVIKSLPEKKRERLYRIIPENLDRLAKTEKLAIDLTGTIENPVINIEPLRNEIRKNLPYIIKQFNDTLGEGGILNILLKDVKSDKIKNALGLNGEKSSISSGSSLGDLLKLIE